MIAFDKRYDSVETIKKIRAKALDNLSNGILITEFNSEGTLIKGFAPCKTDELLLATEIFLDDYYGELVTETTPNFNHQ